MGETANLSKKTGKVIFYPKKHVPEGGLSYCGEESERK